MTKIAVIGLGAMGTNHLRVLMDMDEVEVVGIADSSTETLSLHSKKYGLQTYSDGIELLDKVSPEAIVIAVPTCYHHAIAIEALKRKIHVLVEKPIAASISEAEEMIQCSEDSGAILSVGHIERFNPAIVTLKNKLSEGMLGKLFMIHSRRLSPYPKRILDVGVGSDLATHELDMMYYLTGSEFSLSSSEVSWVMGNEAKEDIIFGLLKFDNDALGVLNVNWVTPTTVREISLTGEQGMFVANYLTQELTFYENPGSLPFDMTNWRSEMEFTVDAGNMTRFQVVRQEPLRSELKAFVESIRTNGPSPVSGQDGLRALKLALQIVEVGSNK